MTKSIPEGQAGVEKTEGEEGSMREIDIFGGIGRSATVRLDRLVDGERTPSLIYDARYWDDPYGTYGGYQYDSRYEAAAKRMVDEFGLSPGDKVLEVGCAKGFVLVELQKRGMRVRGMEVSEYAVRNSHPDLRGRISILNPDKWPSFWKPFDFVLCKEVLPHLAEESLRGKINYLRHAAPKQFIEIQVAETPEAQEKMRAWDPTHQTCKPADWWRALLTSHGYTGGVHFKELFPCT